MYTGTLRFDYGTYESLIAQWYTNTDALLRVKCRTRVIPPTKVVWMHDGEFVNMDSGFEQSQVITSRYSAKYDNILTVKNATFALGRHNYTCIIENCHENTSISKSITTDISRGMVLWYQ